MSTSAQVRTAWSTYVLQHASAQAFTTQMHLFEINDQSEHALELIRYNTEINFVQCLIARAQRSGETSRPAGTSVQYDYTVEVRYTREAEPSGANWTAVIDFFDTLQSLVLTQLGNSWQNTVDMYAPQEGVPSIEEIVFDNTKAWQGRYTWAATKYTSL